MNWKMESSKKSRKTYCCSGMPPAPLPPLARMIIVWPDGSKLHCPCIATHQSGILKRTWGFANICLWEAAVSARISRDTQWPRIPYYMMSPILIGFLQPIELTHTQQDFV